MNPTFHILPASPAEYETIRQIAHATWPDTFSDILSPAQIEYMLEMMYSIEAIEEQIAKGHIFHLLIEAVKADDQADYPKGRASRFRPVAYVSHQLNYLPRTTKIHKIYALPEVQGRGYGKALINEIAMIARNAGQAKLRLDVNYQNQAIGFYESLGFEKTERFTTNIGNGYLMEDWIMEKEL